MILALLAHLNEDWVNSPFSQPDIAGQTLINLSLMLLKVAYYMKKKINLAPSPNNVQNHYPEHILTKALSKEDRPNVCWDACFLNPF